MAEEQSFCEEFESSLSDLTFNSKPLINMLTMLAEEHAPFATHVVRLIEARLNKAKPTEKLPVLYLLDSILKNISGTYQGFFTHNIVETFCGVFEKVDEKTRQAMFKLRTTWNEYFPSSKLHSLDVKVNTIDPAWPIMAPPPTIHVNPKFIKKADSGPSVLPETPAPPVVSRAQLGMNDALLQRQAEQEKQEALMRQQLIAKQHELLQLQQKKLEMELLQTKSKIEEQTRDLEVKKQELQQQSMMKSQLEHQQLQQQIEESQQQLQKMTYLQSQPPQHLQQQNLQQVQKTQPQSTAISSTRDPRVNVRDPRRSRDPRMGAQQITNTQAKVTVPAVQEIIQEFTNSPKGSPVYDSQRVSPSRDHSDQAVKSTDKKGTNQKDNLTDSKAVAVKPTRQYRRQEKDKFPNGKDNKTDAKGKSSNNVKSDSKKDKKENKSDEKKDDGKKKGDNNKTEQTNKNKKSEKDRKPIIKKDNELKSSDKTDRKKDKPKEKKVEIKEDSTRSSGSRRNSSEDRKKSRSLSPKRSRSKSPLRTGSRSPRSRGSSPKSDRRYRDRSPLRRPRSNRIRDSKDRDERRPRENRMDDKSRKENDKKDDSNDPGRKVDKFLDDRFARRRPGNYPGPDHLPPKKKPRMGRGQENTWDDRRKQGWGEDRPWSRAPGRRLIERRVSLDPDVKIPRELTLNKQKEILEQAEKQLHSGTLSHEQHQDLLRQLNDLYQLQRIKKEERVSPGPVAFSDNYDWPVRDYDARRDTNVPQTFFKEMERVPTLPPEIIPSNALDVDERNLDSVMSMQSDSKGFTHIEDGKNFGEMSSKVDVDMRELPMSGEQPRQAPGQSSQPRSYPPPLMSITIRPPGTINEDKTQVKGILDDKGGDSPLSGDSMFGSTDQDMRTLDSSLPFGPGMKDKDMRQLPGSPEQMIEEREAPREGHRPGREVPRAIRGGHRQMAEGSRPKPDDQRPMNDRRKAMMEGPRSMMEDEPKPVIEGPRLLKEGPKPIIDDPRSMMDGPKPRTEGPRPMMEGPRTKMEGPRRLMDGPRPGMGGPRPMIDGTRPMVDGPRMMMDGPRTMMDVPRPILDGQLQRMNVPMIQPNMAGQLAMMRGPGPQQRMPMMALGMPQSQSMPMTTQQQLMPMTNQAQSQSLPMMSQQQIMAGLAAPMMQQLSMSMMPLAQQLPQMHAAMQMRANVPNMAQGFPMAGPVQGMMNFGMRGPMPAPSMPQHVLQQQQPTGATPPPPQPQPQPPQEHVTTQVDVNSLFSKLLSAGIISKTGNNNSPRPEGTETPPPPSSQETTDPEKKEEDDEEDEEELVIPEIGFYPEELRVRFQGVINRIYNGIQCSSCGLRFMPEEMDKYAKHLDWHFRLNRREKDGAKKATSRKWYYKLDDWIKFEEIDELEEGARSEFFELQARLGLSEMMKKPNPVVSSIAVTGENDTEEVCDICQEKFDQFWDEDEEQWQLKDAVRVDGKTYHPLCYEDTKDVTLIPDTPTPVEGPSKPAFPVLITNEESTTETKIKTENVDQGVESGEQNTTETQIVVKKEPEELDNVKVEVKQEGNASS
ncbi:pre-mRNA cleavage complex 2 protein Pcf11-like isoform X2 [Glandiceps talaboti]